MRDFCLGALVVIMFLFAGVRWGCVSCGSAGSKNEIHQAPVPVKREVQNTQNVPAKTLRQIDTTNPYL